jgi:hypothetical protein
MSAHLATIMRSHRNCHRHSWLVMELPTLFSLLDTSLKISIITGCFFRCVPQNNSFIPLQAHSRQVQSSVETIKETCHIPTLQSDLHYHRSFKPHTCTKICIYRVSYLTLNASLCALYCVHSGVQFKTPLPWVVVGI